MVELLSPSILRPPRPACSRNDPALCQGRHRVKPQGQLPEMKHPLVTGWKSSLKDASAGRASSQGPGQAAAEEVGHTAASPPAQPQAAGGSSHPIHGPGPRRGLLATISPGLHVPWESNPTLPHCTMGQGPCNQFHKYFFEPEPRAKFIL